MPGAAPQNRGLFNARFGNAIFHGSFLRPGVSLRQGVPEVEVTHGLDHGRRTRFRHPFAGLPCLLAALPGEILK